MRGVRRFEWLEPLTTSATQRDHADSHLLHDSASMPLDASSAFSATLKSDSKVGTG